jgi:hypothetical protein
MQKGNTSNGTMTRRGYDNLREFYEQQTSLRHNLKCVKNRYSQLKTMYSFYKWALDQTGVGRQANGGLDALLSWWERHTKVIFVLNYFFLLVLLSC